MTAPTHAVPLHRPWLSYLCLGASMALVGSYVGGSKLLVLIFPVLLLAWLRFGVAAVAMAGWVRRGAHEAPLSAHDRRLLFFESFFGNFLFSVCMLFGVAQTSALAAGVIMAALPGAVALLSLGFLRERKEDERGGENDLGEAHGRSPGRWIQSDCTPDGTRRFPRLMDARAEN